MRTAKTVRVTAHGGPEVLSIDDITLPGPAAGEVLVDVRAAGVNFMDTQFRSGLYRKPLPFPLGHEGAGIIEAVGPDVSHFAPGDRVAWSQVPGSSATAVLVPIRQLVRLAPTVSFETAAAALFQGLTAHYLACSTYELKPGDVCIVHSAAGGVGLLLCQLARLRGATVIGTVSSPAKIAAAQAAGADHVIVYTQTDFADEARRLTAGRGVDVIYDAIGRDTFEAGLRALRPRGLLALYGEASGVVPPFDVRLLSQASSAYLTRAGLGAYVSAPGELQRRMDDIIAWLAAGTLKPTIHVIYPLAEVAEAHRALEGRNTIGKVLLRP